MIDSWFLYLVECSDHTYYCGITKNIAKRIGDHNKGRGAKYTKGRIPVKLMGFVEYDSRSAASQEEVRIKRLSRREKLEMIQNGGISR